MYSHVACDVMKERTLYLLKPSSLIWHLMPYLFLLTFVVEFGNHYTEYFDNQCLISLDLTLVDLNISSHKHFAFL